MSKWKSFLNKKNRKNLNSEQLSQIIHSYYRCNPRKITSQTKTIEPPFLFLKHELHSTLTAENVHNVAKKLRKLKYPAQIQSLLRAFMLVFEAKETQLPIVISVAAELTRFHPAIGISLVDLILEAILWGMDNAERGTFQKRLLEIKVIGELYMFRLVSTELLINILYFLTTRSRSSYAEMIKKDPPHDFFRTRLVIHLLEICISYFIRAKSHICLEKFLGNFSLYLASKHALPIDIESKLTNLMRKTAPMTNKYSALNKIYKAFFGHEILFNKLETKFYTMKAIRNIMVKKEAVKL